MRVMEPRPPIVGGLPSALVARNFLALASGEVLARVIAFGATIYVARTLGAESYGVIGFAIAVVLYLSRIADGGMEFFGLGVREIAEDRTRIRTLAPHLITARLLVSTVLVVALGVTSLVMPQPDGAVLALYGLTLLAVGGSTRWIHLGLEHSRLVAVARALGEGTMVLLVLTLVRGADDLVRVPLAQFAGDALAALILLAAVHRFGFRLTLAFDIKRVLPVFRQAAPLVASALLGLMIYNADLIFLRFFRDATAVGYYAAAYTLISFLLNLGSAYCQSMLPTLTRLGATGSGRQELFHTATAQVFAVTLPLAAGGYLVAPQLIDLVFGEAYRASVPGLQLLIWTVPLAVIREVSIVTLVVTGRQQRVLRLTGWAASLNLVLNLALVPRFGIIGAASATVATECVRTATALWFTRGAGYQLPGVVRFWRAAVATAVMAVLVLAVGAATLWVSIALGAAAYVAVLAAVGGVRIRWRELPALTV